MVEFPLYFGTDLILFETSVLITRPGTGWWYVELKCLYEHSCTYECTLADIHPLSDIDILACHSHAKFTSIR